MARTSPVSSYTAITNGMSLSDHNFDEHEHAYTVQQQFEAAHVHFLDNAFDDDDVPVMCQLHDAFGTQDTNHHNCLGCNFADSIWLIESFLKSYATQDSIQFSYTTFLVLCYLLVERIDSMFDFIQLNEDYRKEHFKILLAIRRWANFIKHPKAFLLTHHAEYTFQNSPKNGVLRDNASVIIDRTFIDKYYSNNDKNKELYKELENKENVLVIFPDAKHVTEQLCDAIKLSISVVKDNPIYRDVLAQRSTFADYWFDA